MPPLHVVQIMANNSKVHYFTHFANGPNKENDIKISFIALHNEKPEMLSEMKEKGWDCYWVPFDQNRRKTNMVTACWKLIRLFKKIKPDVIHSHLFDDTLPSMLAGKIAGVKIRVVTKSDTGYHYTYTPKWMAFDKFNNFNATHIVSVSKESCDFIIQKEKAKESKCHVIHHGVLFDDITNYSEEVRLKYQAEYSLEGKKVIGVVARYVDWKNHNDIILAAPKILEKFPDARFLFVGSGPLENQLKSLVSQSGLSDKIIFTKWIPKHDMPSVYRLMDVLIHAAKMEPFGFVYPEAMMNGVPVVSTRTGAAADFIEHKVNGYLADHGEIDEIANGVEYILNNNPQLIGQNGKEIALKNMSFERMYNDHIALYKDAVKEH